MDNADVALDEGREPPAVHILFYELLVEIQVPEVTMIGGNALQLVLRLLRQELNAPLPRSSQVVAVRKVKAFAQVLLQLGNVLRHLIHDIHLQCISIHLLQRRGRF